MKKIVVLGNDVDMLESARMYLSEHGYQTELVAEWQKIYGIVRSSKPDLIIIDVQLFGMDGRIICQNLKEFTETRHVPIIMVSSFLLTDESIRSYGGDEFLPKPFLEVKLLECVGRLIGK